MPHKLLRKSVRTPGQEALFNVLLVEDDVAYALSLKHVIEARLRVAVTIAHTDAEAKKMLQADANQFFIGLTSVLDMDASAFKKIDMLGKFNLSVIAIVNDYEDEMRDQLIKRHVIDYVVKGNNFDDSYICDLIWRIYKNSKIKVLVADDSVVSRFVIARELALQKFQVIHAKNGQRPMTIPSAFRPIIRQYTWVNWLQRQCLSNFIGTPLAGISQRYLHQHYF